MKVNGRTRLAVAAAAACALVSPAAAQVQQVLQPEAISRTDRSFELGVRAAPMARGTALPELATPDELALRAAPPPSGSPPVDPGAEFDIALLQSRIWNPNTGRFDLVEHRGYVDRRVGTTEGNLYQAPLIEARPGETVRINFRNLLPAEPNCTHTPETMNNPDQKACYNDTNNHFHGGWVNPDGISDNVLRVLKPHPTHLYEYEYNIPQEHPAGTFWYHPHVHGSTAIQVGSGMAGALIIRGDRWPVAIDDVAFTPGDIDVLLRTSDGQAIPDKVFLLQQIQYACGQDAAGQNIWNCPEGEVGRLDSYKLFLNPGPQWAASQRFTTVNGRVAAPLPETAVAGQPQRWRFIHGGVSDSVRVEIYRKREAEELVAGEPTLFERTAAADQDTVIREACLTEEDPVAMFEIATDGLTRPDLLEATSRILHPAYRSDVLVSFDDAGDYCVIDGAIPAGQGVPGSLDSRRLLFTLTVDPAPAGTTPLPAREAILGMLEAAAEAGPLDDALKERVVEALGEGDLSFFAPHATLAATEIDHVQNVRFALGGGLQTGAPTVPAGAGVGYRRTVSGEPVVPILGQRRYSASPEDTIVLEVGDVDEWRLTSGDAPHPFHIHVNPFEVMAVNKPVTVDGVVTVRDLTVEDDVDGNGNDVPSQYAGMKGVFKDTIIIQPGVEVVLRSHYTRYIGSFVIHCHILYHEDIGMMRNVRIVDPAGDGGIVAADAGVHH